MNARRVTEEIQESPSEESSSSVNEFLSSIPFDELPPSSQNFLSEGIFTTSKPKVRISDSADKRRDEENLADCTFGEFKESNSIEYLKKRIEELEEEQQYTFGVADIVRQIEEADQRD